MSTSFAAQLNEIAKSSTDELNLKAQKQAHSQSLIFEKHVAASQSFAVIYQICLEGYEDLCRLDARFVGFSDSIFSPQSQNQERGQMTREQNSKLDTVLQSFLGLVGAKLLLKPAVKAVEWLIRRFRVHENNTAFLLLTFLPYYATPIFQNLLSILPSTIPPAFKFLAPYLKGLTSPPRHAIIYSATSNDGFFAALNEYTIQLCRQDSQHPPLLSFWAAVCVEAVSKRLDQAKAGRLGIQRQREEDTLIKILPALNDGLFLRNSVELTIACYTISIVLITKATLADKVLNGLMEAVAGSFNAQTSTAGIICLVIVSGQRENYYLPGKVISAIQRVPEVDQLLLELGTRYDTVPIMLGIAKGCVSAIGSKKAEAKIQFIRALLQKHCFPEKALPKVIEIILHAAENATGDSISETCRSSLRGLVDLLKDQGQFSMALSGVLSRDKVNVDRLEANMQVTVHVNGNLESSRNVDMAEDVSLITEDAFDTSLKDIPTSTPESFSFLKADQMQLYDQLSSLLHATILRRQTLENFESLPIFGRAPKPSNPIYLSFFLRVLVEDKNDSARVAAMESIALAIRSTSSSVDLHTLLPYLLIAMADPVSGVRKAASQIIMTSIDPDLASTNPSTNTTDSVRILLYTQKDRWEQAFTLSSSDLSRIVRKVILPIIEDCVLDPDQVKRALESALKGNSSSTHVNDRLQSIDIKKALRSSLFGFLIDHILHIPLYSVKLRLLELLSPIHRVGSKYKSDELLPLLLSWASESEMRPRTFGATGTLDVGAVDEQMAKTFSSKDKNVVGKMLSILQPEGNPRDEFVDALFRRLIEIWPTIKHDGQSAASELLLDRALSPDDGNERNSRFCRDVLRAVNVPSEMLSALLEKTIALVAERQDRPPTKKRRISQHQHSSDNDNDLKEALVYVDRLSFVLEVIDGSEPEQRPVILKTLFKALGSINRLKARFGQGMGYILTLTLGNILSIVKHAKIPTALQLDSPAIRIDHVIDCVRLSENQQAQNTALLVIANIARLAPDIVLHSVMPIFTFIGSNMSRKDDEYSAHVIDQTIDHVIPPLIQSLRVQKKDVLAGATELLSSFTAAFEHIPSHRRSRLFETLIDKLGPEDFLFTAFALLGTRDIQSNDKHSFVSLIASKFSLAVQFTSIQKLLALTADALSRDPKQAQTILNINQMDTKERRRTVESLILILPSLFKQRALGILMDKSLLSNSADTLITREAFAAILEQLIHLRTSVQGQNNLGEAATAAMNSLLELPSLPELISITNRLLANGDDELQQKTLRLVEKRLTLEVGTNTATQSAAIEFLEPLVNVLEVSSDTLLKHATVTCIDQITERYGRKNFESILQCARVVVGPKCQDAGDEQLALISLLCLSTMIETCKQAMIPVLPDTLSCIFEQISACLQESKKDERLYNAAFSLLLSIVSTLPWMLSEDDIVSTLHLSSESTGIELGTNSGDLRKEVFLVMARKVELRAVVAAIKRGWSVIASNGIEALKDAITLLSNSIDSHSKTVIVRNSESLLELFLLAFDLRRFHLIEATDDSYTESEIDEVEVELHSIFLQMVYKLNDSTFRPLFQHLVEWSLQASNTAHLTSAEKDRTHRQTSIFKLFAHLFVTLKSLVTSYAGSILQPVAEFLKYTIDSRNEEATEGPDSFSHTLWISILSMLQPLFEHDQDAYFSTPSHFSTLCGPLTSQLKLAASGPFKAGIKSHLIPSIVALAHAVASTPSHHQALNKLICDLRHDTRREVRLASVRCQAALTDELAEEWLENVSAEMMIYVNEMLEDDEEEVEREVRRWVVKVQEVLGEEIGV